MIDLSHDQILLILQWSHEKWDQLEADKGYGDERVVNAQVEVEAVQERLKEAL